MQLLPTMKKPPFDGFAIEKVGGELHVHDFGGYETRNPSTIILVKAAIGMYPTRDFDWVLVNTSDREHQLFHEGLKVFSYSTMTDSFAHTCPDFVYDHWRQTGLDDYEDTRRRLAAESSPPLTQMIGWRGALTHPIREALTRLDDKQDFDFELIKWDRADPNNLTASNYLSFDQQVGRWRYLIDLEGIGYSARLKMLLNSPRVVFIQERPHKEDFFQHLVPWVHYVPVKGDLSDLRDSLKTIRNDPALETDIIANARAFSEVHLSRAGALKRWSNLLNMD